MADPGAWRDFRKEIEEALDLLRGQADAATGTAAAAHGEVRGEVLASALPSLLEQCRDMAGPPEAPPGLPAMRSLHHFACTGGTLISRCIGAMPNTQLLSEVDPLSPIGQNPAFLPSNLIGLARLGSRPPGDAILVDMFRAGLGRLAAEAHRSGLHLVLRDHSHSLFCLGAAIPQRPTLREMLAPAYALRGLVSVRHPLESFLALLHQGWIHFEPATLEEYARRYMAFLDRHDGTDILRYEDFLTDPEAAMQRSCQVLDLAYNPDFRDLFPAIRLSGDSGRRGDEIAPRPRRPVPDDLHAQIARSPAYAALCARLDYDPAP